MFQTILDLAAAALSLWASAERDKYTSQFAALQEAYYAEYNLPLDQRSDANLDNLSAQLRVLAGQLSTDISLTHSAA